MLHLQPPFYPNVCIRCGCGTGQREFFVDLGINLSGYFNPMHEGDIYYCNECVRNLIVDINRLLAKREEDTAPWAGDARVDITYNWQNDIDLSGVEVEIERTRVNVESSDSNSESNDTGIEQGTNTPATTASVPESTVLTVLSDDESTNGGISLDFNDD